MIEVTNGTISEVVSVVILKQLNTGLIHVWHCIRLYTEKK